MEKIILQPGEEKTIELTEGYDFMSSGRKAYFRFLGDGKWLWRNNDPDGPLEVWTVPRER